jgi:hypothetical protein
LCVNTDRLQTLDTVFLAFYFEESTGNYRSRATIRSSSRGFEQQIIAFLMPTFSFVGDTILPASHSSMSVESSFAKRISPQSAAGEVKVASTKIVALRDLTNTNEASVEEDTTVGPKVADETAGAPAAEKKQGGDKESEQDLLLAEVCRTWTAGKHTRVSSDT